MYTQNQPVDPDDPTLRDAENVAQEMYRDTLNRHPWRAAEAAILLAEALELIRQRPVRSGS